MAALLSGTGLIRFQTAGHAIAVPRERAFLMYEACGFLPATPFYMLATGSSASEGGPGGAGAGDAAVGGLTIRQAIAPEIALMLFDAACARVFHPACGRWRPVCPRPVPARS